MRKIPAAIVVGVTVLLTACVQTAAVPLPDVSPTPTSSVAPTNAGRSLSFALKAQYAKAHGVVNVTVGPTSYEISVTMSELAPDALYLLNLHNGSCDLEDTAYLVDMGRFRSDGNGNATYARTFLAAFTVPAAGRIVTLHGPLNTDQARVHIACGDMPG